MLHCFIGYTNIHLIWKQSSFAPVFFKSYCVTTNSFNSVVVEGFVLFLKVLDSLWNIDPKFFLRISSAWFHQVGMDIHGSDLEKKEVNVSILVNTLLSVKKH